MVDTRRPEWNRIPAGRGSCPTGKVTYISRKQAKTAARRIPDGHGLRPYTCPKCSGVHLGHKPARVRNGEVDKADWLNGKDTAK